MKLMVIRPKSENAIEVSVTDPDGKASIAVRVYCDDVPPTIRIVPEAPRRLTVSLTMKEKKTIFQDVDFISLDLPKEGNPVR